MRILIECGVNVNQKDKCEWTSLHYASHYGYVERVKILIDYADLSIKNKMGQTALDIARTDEIKSLIASKLK
jgi:ankyrin repeat protein